jgi:hypothetical protein
MVVTWTKSGCRGVKIAPDRTLTKVLDLSQLTASDPNEIRPGSLSFKIRAGQKNNNLGGIVRFCSLPQGFIWSFANPDTTKVSATFHSEIAAIMDNHPKCSSCTALSLERTKTFVIPVASKINYSQYYGFDTTNDQATLNQVLTLAGQYAPMNMLLIEFATPPTSQVFDVSVHSVDWCRFPANSLYSNLARTPTPVSQATFDAEQQVLQSHASTGMHLDGA